MLKELPTLRAYWSISAHRDSRYGGGDVILQSTCCIRGVAALAIAALILSTLLKCLQGSGWICSIECNHLITIRSQFAAYR